MSAKKTGLGRGLNELGLGELLSSVKSTTIAQEKNVGSESTMGMGLRKMAIDLLRPNRYQPRQDVDSASLNELAESIKTQGIIQPILVRPHAGKDYEIIAGERRWRAAQLAGLTEVPIIVKELSDEQAAAIALIENLQREDLNAIDTAQGLQRLIAEFGMTHQTVAEAIGKSRTTVTNLLRLLNLPDVVKHMVQRGELEMGHARALLALSPYQQLQAATNIVSKGLSVRAAEELVQKFQHPQTAAPTAKKLDPNILQLQNKLRDSLGTKVKIQHSGKGKGHGKVIVYYNNLDDLDGILGRMLPE
jgi:ParB family chromosome partitioning protein